MAKRGRKPGTKCSPEVKANMGRAVRKVAAERRLDPERHAEWRRKISEGMKRAAAEANPTT